MKQQKTKKSSPIVLTSVVRRVLILFKSINGKQGDH